MREVLILSVATVVLSGCATAYQPVGLTGGYSQTQLGENVFRVSFQGNGYTSSERAFDLSLLRSAEVALEHDFRYFVIVESKNGSRVEAFTTPTTSYTTGNAHGLGNYAYGSATTTTYGGQTYLFPSRAQLTPLFALKRSRKLAGSLLTLNSLLGAPVHAGERARLLVGEAFERVGGVRCMREVVERWAERFARAKKSHAVGRVDRDFG